jgi:hypothetical protein
VRPSKGEAELEIVIGIPPSVVLALTAGILATGFAQEIRRHAFLRTWDIVAKVPFLPRSVPRQSPKLHGCRAPGLSRRRQPDFERVIHGAAHQPLGPIGTQQMREHDAALDVGISV